MRYVLPASFVLASLAMPMPASAQLPESVRQMVEAAIETADQTTVDTVIGLAKKTNPADIDELTAIHDAFNVKQRTLAAAEAKAKQEAVRTAGLFRNWEGKGELGASRSTGNSSNTGVTVGLKLTRDGIDWRHKLRAHVDYQRSNGRTSREQYLVAYEPNYQLSDRVFLYGLAQYESNRFQGFSARYATSGGIGYQIIKDTDLQLSAKIGPAYRITDFVSGESESRIAGLLGLDFDWDITDRLKLTHDTNAVTETGGSATVLVDSSTTSVHLVTGLNAKVSSKMTARFSYAVEYDSNPPLGAVQTDTLSRATLVYDF